MAGKILAPAGGVSASRYGDDAGSGIQTTPPARRQRTARTMTAPPCLSVSNGGAFGRGGGAMRIFSRVCGAACRGGRGGGTHRERAEKPRGILLFTGAGKMKVPHLSGSFAVLDGRSAGRSGRACASGIHRCLHGAGGKRSGFFLCVHHGCKYHRLGISVPGHRADGAFAYRCGCGAHAAWERPVPHVV